MICSFEQQERKFKASEKVFRAVGKIICSFYQWARFFENQARRLKQQAIFFVIFIRVKLLCKPGKVLENFCNAQGHLSIRKFALNHRAW